MNKWKVYKNEFQSYLKIERSLSSNTIDGYLEDMNKLEQFMDMDFPGVPPEKV